MVCVCGAAIVVGNSGSWVHVEEWPDGYGDHDAIPRADDALVHEREPTPSERQAAALEGIASSLDTLITLVKRSIASG